MGLTPTNWAYQYDQNGNMTQRAVGGQTYNPGYDAENCLISVSGATTASFVHDRDEKRMRHPSTTLRTGSLAG